VRRRAPGAYDTYGARLHAHRTHARTTAAPEVRRRAGRTACSGGVHMPLPVYSGVTSSMPCVGDSACGRRTWVGILYRGVAVTCGRARGGGGPLPLHTHYLIRPTLKHGIICTVWWQACRRR